MEIIQSIILGIVQGSAEFLPISSSGHLILIPRVFGWHDQGLAFDVALHWGTLIAALAYFWKEWISIIKKSYLINRILISNFQFLISKQIPNPKSQNPRQIQSPKFQSSNKLQITNYKLQTQHLKSDLLFIIIVATIPGIIAGVLLNDYAETIFRNPVLVSVTLSAGALLLFYSDRVGIKEKNINNITLRNGIIIGLAQALAIFPGVSRSGITITAALFLGSNRTSAARFSFLLSAPIILGASIKEFPVLLQEYIGPDLIFGTLVAAISGYLAIKYMLKYLENRSYNIFVGYRIALALIIIILFF